jgi:hypothetical protein
MTGINASTPSLLQQGLEGLKRGIREGTLRAGRIEVPGASPEHQAKLEQKYQADVRDLEQKKTDYRTAVARTTVNAENNSALLPDVATLSKAEAKSMLSGLQQMKFVGDLDSKTLSANNGSNSTDSVEVYMQWLQARTGIDVYA